MQTEADVERFMLDQLPDYGVLIRQLQGLVAPAVVRLLEDAGYALDFGVADITGNGTPSAAVAVAHGFAAAPVVALGGQWLGANLNVTVTAVSASQVTFGAQHIHNANWSSTNQLAWLALGAV